MPAPLRARDVRDALKEHGFEMGVMSILERMCDERAGDRQTMHELAQMMAQCIDNVSRMVEVGDAMDGKLKEIQRRDQQFNDLDNIPPSDR